MATVQDGITKLELIKDLPSRSSINATDLYLLQTSVQSFKLQHSDLVSNLVDNTTIEANNSKLRVKNNGIDLTKLADINASTSSKVIGRISGSGDPELIDIDTDLSTVSATHNTIPSALAVKNYTESNVSSFQCRAWVNFDGTNVTNVGGEDRCFIRGSGNISKVVRNGNGRYTIHFSTPMIGANYSIQVTSGKEGQSNVTNSGHGVIDNTVSDTITENYCRVLHGLGGNTSTLAVNTDIMCVSIFK